MPSPPSDPTPVGPVPSTPTSLPRNVWVLTLTSFLTDVSSEMLTTLIPLFLSQVLGARTAAIGLIEGVAETTASLVKLVSGGLSDRLGRRKPVTVLGYGISAAAKPFLLAAGSWPAVLLVRFADRVGKGVRTAPRDALLADGVAPSQRGLAFGLHRAGDTAGAVVGLLVALGCVWGLERGSGTLDPSVFRTLVVLSTVPAALGVLVLALGAREARPSGAPAAPMSLSLAPFDRRFRHYLLTVVVFTLGNSSDAFLVLRAREAGLPVAGVVGMMLSFNLVYTLVAAPAGALSDRFGRKRVLAAGWLVYALIYLGFAAVRTGAEAWLLMAAYGVYYGATEGAAKAFVADLVAPGVRGTAFGVYHAAVGLAALPASLAAGILWQGLGPWPGFGPSAPFLFGSVMAVLATVLLLTDRTPQSA